MNLTFSMYRTKIIYIAMLLGIQLSAANSDVTYFDGTTNQSMSVKAEKFAPEHPACCVEKKASTPIAAAPIPVTEKDSDGDGVLDSKDKCPDTPKGYQVDSNGCPQSVTLHMNFAFASNEIPASSDNDISELVQFMSNNPACIITIIGHTDNIGNDERNQPRSEARAKALADKLIAKGIDINRIKTSGQGSHQPIATNATDAGRAQNRRIEIEIR
ncbi:MAG: OmpA family protein [Sulfuricurvum sp.]|nr:OmpA family protein [Sulfuricurvum sp.]